MKKNTKKKQFPLYINMEAQKSASLNAKTISK